MIERLYVKDLVTFKEAELFFKPSLVVFTGPSGAGKSVLLGALLALFGLKGVEAKVSEVDLQGSFDLEEWGYDQEDIVTIKALKKEKVRYFLNAQSISKKSLQKIFSSYVSYLHQRDNDFFKSANLLTLIDQSIEDEEFYGLKEEYRKLYERFVKLQKQIDELVQMERRNEELKEFLEFEIAKIEKINPKEGEYEELLKVKKELSQKEKILQAIERAEGVVEYEGAVLEALEAMGVDSSFFQEALIQLQDHFLHERSRLEELDENSIEEVLERIEELSSLKRRYGSIEEALKVKEEKKRELDRLMNLEFEKEHLLKELKNVEVKLYDIAKRLSQKRKAFSSDLQDRINKNLHLLKLPTMHIDFVQKELDTTGMDEVRVDLDGVPFDKISSGEYNRLRLAFMAATRAGEGVLILDEIDANISGEESMAVAKILKELAKRYQIFAISHQAQLASLADQHFLVEKVDGVSIVNELEGKRRIQEIARIISGEKITQEAIAFANKLLKEHA